jgi:hypothetical protein
MTFSDIKSELGKSPYLTHCYQKSYMTFSDIESELRKLTNLTQYYQKFKINGLIKKINPFLN